MPHHVEQAADRHAPERVAQVSRHPHPSAGSVVTTRVSDGVEHAPLGPTPERQRIEQRIQERLQHLDCGALDGAVVDTGEGQPPRTATRPFRDLDHAVGRGRVGAGAEVVAHLPQCGPDGGVGQVAVPQPVDAGGLAAVLG